MKRFFLMLLASCALSVFAETAIVNDITWSYQVSGESTATLGAGTSPVTGALVIPAEIAGYVVTAIGDEAFYNCTGLTSVTIPSSVTAIGFSAFGACSQLTEVIFEGEPPAEVKASSFPEVAGYYSVQHADAWAAVIQEGTWKRLTMGQKMVNVVFDANGGEGGETFTSAYGASVTEPTVMREGYTFLGWDKEVATVVSLEDVTYTAQWREGYVWDAAKSGFYDSTGKEAVIEGEFTLMVDFTMPNVNKMAENLFMFKAMKGEREIGEVGFCHLSSNTKLRYSIGELVQDPNAYYSAGYYSNVCLYNGGVGSNLATISLFNPAEGLPTVANIVVDFANGETTGVETRKRGTFFSEYGFSLTSLDLGEGVEVNSAYLMPAPRHLQVPNKECFSVNFATGREINFYTVIGATGLYAVKGWNNLLGQNGARTALDMWDGTSLTSTNVGITYSASNSYDWTTASDAFLKAYLDEYGQSVEITLEDIPFSQYSVIVYTATDEVNARFKPVQINGVYYAGANTYTHGVGYAVKVSEVDKANGWGASRSHYARFGTNALRVDGLSGDLTIQGGEYIAKCRGCIAAIQVINTGNLSNDIVYVGRQAMGRAYSLMFRGTHSTDWLTVNNWQTLTTTLSEEGTPIETWEDYSGNVPGIKQGNFHDSLLIDGALLSDNITLENNYKLVNAPTLEGWNQVIGVVNGAHLSIERLTKLQADSDWRVDETSKMTIGGYNTSNSREGTHNILCLAEEGIEFKTNCDVSFNYALGKAGSVCYAGLSGTHTIQELELDLGDSSKVGIELKRRKLIGFTSSSATFNAKNSIVTTTEEGVPAVETALPLRVGEYTFEVQEDGYYVNYMAYGDNIRQVLQATISRNMSLSEIKFVGGESVVVELTLADGVTLTIDEAPLLAAIRLISSGDISIVGSVEAFENVGGFVAIDVQGDATYEAVGYYYEIPFAKLIGFDKIKKTGSVEWRPNDLSALKDYQLEVANGKMLVNTAMQTVVATAEKPVLVTGEGAILRFEGNQEQNRMPNDGYVRAEKGAQIELKGVNPFNQHNAPRVVLDEGILKVEATNGCHLKLHSVTMSNGSEIQLSRMATAHVSEGLVLRAQDSATILATTGNNTIKYLDDGTATNVLQLLSGIVDVAQGATLDVQVAVTTSARALTKRGEGTLIWNGTTTFPFVIDAGEIAFNANAQPTNAFSGTGVIVADGATLDLTKATVTDCALAVRNHGVLILNQNQVGQMTVPAGCTLKVKVADYEALTLEGVTLAEGENVTFILPNGTEVEGNGNALSKQFAVTASFGLNFSHENGEDVIVPANGVGVGFFTEKYAAPTYWRNGQSSAADQGDFILENGTLYRVYWTAWKPFSSECGLDTDIKKLLHTYLDDRSYQGEPGRVKASVTITNLPEDKKYAVALILAGDADNTTAMYNHKYSPVLINGQVYSYDAQANLLTGEAAQSATQWGNRSKAISEEGKLTIGTNVMFVEGLSGGVLSITSAMDEIDVSRLTIAGVQVWITNEDVTPAASPISENAEAISVNFNTEPAGYAVAAEQSAGLYAVDGWNNTLGASGALSTLNISNGESEMTLPISLKFASQNVYEWASATKAYLKGYLDDCDRAPQVEVSNIPFETYSVIVYSATDTVITDTVKCRFWPIQVNGTHYVGSSTYNPGIGYAASVESSKVSRLPWGGSRNLTAVYGTNAIRVDGLTGETLTIKTASGTSKSPRGGIAAIQIVNTGAPVMTEVQEIDWTEFGATFLAVSDLADLITKPIVKLKVAAGASLVVDQSLAAYTIKVVSTGDVAIKVTNLEAISGTMLQQMFDKEYVEGSVTYDYEETFGYTKDDVTYPLIFRGTTDANWDTVTNWYTVRKNATETYWMPYTATLAPNLRLSLDWNAVLFDGDLIGDNIDEQSDGYKTITVTTPVEGWTSQIRVMNGVHLKIDTLCKLQGGGTWRIDETSKITVTKKWSEGTNDTNNRYYVEAEEGIVFENMPLPGGTAYFGVKGSIRTGSFAAAQSIGEVVLDLGDSSLLGKRTVSRRLYAFTTGTTFNVANCTVKTTVDTITATKVETLQNVGDYWFESKADGYYINYVAYAPKLPESVTGETAEWLQEVLAQAGVTSSEVTLADGVTVEMLEEARLLGVIPDVEDAEVAVATSFTVCDIVVDETTLTLAVMIVVEQGELPETITLGGEVKLMVAQSLADEWTTVVPTPENIEVIRASDPNIQEAVISVTYDRSDYKFFRVVVTP